MDAITKELGIRQMQSTGPRSREYLVQRLTVVYGADCQKLIDYLKPFGKTFAAVWFRDLDNNLYLTVQPFDEGSESQPQRYGLSSTYSTLNI